MMSTNLRHWRNVTLGDVASESTERHGRDTADCPIYGVDRNIGLTSTPKYAAKDLTRYKRLLPGMFAYNPMRLNIGSIGFCPESATPGLVSPDYIVFRCDEDRLNSEYLNYLTRSLDWRRWTERSGGGSVRIRIYFNELARMPLRLPPITEQRSIVAALNTFKQKTEMLRQQNETLQTIAQTLFKSWFVDFDPVRSKAGGFDSGLHTPLDTLFPNEFEDSELGEIPKGWTVSTVGRVATKIGSGATPRGGSDVYVDDGMALIRSQNVYDSEFVWDGLARITDAAAVALQGVTVEPEDILLNITGGSILRTCVVTLDVLPARVNQHVCIIRPMAHMPVRYLHLHLLQSSTKAFLMGMDAGASRQAVTKGHIESVPLIIPPPLVLDRFASFVGPLFHAIENNNSQSRTLAALRDTLLPKLISGELPMKAAEKIIEAVA